ncbi:uncharacterized protein ISCGN_014637 [Ixodes scapularis]
MERFKQGRPPLGQDRNCRSATTQQVCQQVNDLLCSGCFIESYVMKQFFGCRQDISPSEHCTCIKARAPGEEGYRHVQNTSTCQEKSKPSHLNVDEANPLEHGRWFPGHSRRVPIMPGASKSGLDKKKASAKTLVTLFPKIPKTATVLLEFFIRRESKISVLRDPLSHFCQEEVVLHAQDEGWKRELIALTAALTARELVPPRSAPEQEKSKPSHLNVDEANPLEHGRWFPGHSRRVPIMPGASKSGLDKKKASAKTLVTLFPKIPKTATVLLEFFIRRESKISVLRDPLSHFCQEEVVLHAQECLLKLNKQVITYQDIRDMVENLVGLHNMCIKKDPDVAKTLGTAVRKLTIIIGEVATLLEKLSEVPVTDWMAIGDAIIHKLERMNLPEQPSLGEVIPKMRDFKNIKMLGAGGFGAVYLANFKPANFIATIKLVARDRFTSSKQAAMDKVVASVIRNPFLVKYYSCFCVKEAYVTVMEYIAGLDLMHVVSEEGFLETEAVKIVMAQLILALEHMHLRGFLHRDIKVSNMLILPGGRVKVIDFDTTKVCHGHFAKRPLRGYFHRTPFEFHDGESAGTVPYMAPEILKKRPYGRSADWWSAGIVMYKLLTGRVPFRGKNREMIRERIITAPLKWPRAEEHPHSATVPAKDMTYRMLRKNPVERLGSSSYNDLKAHPFFDRFNWKLLYTQTQLCDIPSIAKILKSKQNEKEDDGEKKRSHHQQIDDMTDIEAEAQKPLLCYASASFRKLMSSVKQGKTRVNDDFMESSSSQVWMNEDSPHPAFLKLSVTCSGGVAFCTSLGETKCSSHRGIDLRSTFFDQSVVAGSPADKSQVLPLDVILGVSGVAIKDAKVGRVKKLIASTGDQMVLSVMASSPYRALTTRRDMMNLMRSVPKEAVVVKSGALSCSGSRPYGLGFLEARVWDDKARQFGRAFVLSHSNIKTVNNNPLFPGDVVTHVNGTALESLTREQVIQLLSSGKNEATLSVVPLSPLRAKRIMIPKTATVLLEFFIRRESKISVLRDPLSHFCQEEVVLHAQECLLKLNKQVITYQDIRDMVENLVGLHNMCIKKDPDVAKTLGTAVRKLTIIIGEVATLLEKLSEVPVTDWMAIGDAIIHKLERMNLPEQPSLGEVIPKMRDFKNIKMLGAGGFGAVYLANFKPANFIATIKLVARDRFTSSKQAAMDKVVASVIRNPFLVKYYSCFCVKEAYVTVMEYIAGLDLMHVVSEEGFLETEAVKIVMAQLILALEHMHLRGFLHRDIKVSNMLILPGGRVKVIDFDTTKVCHGHFAKRPLRGYFHRTPFEFHDGESAGTVPYMAPEILKKRPYVGWLEHHHVPLVALLAPLPAVLS